MDMIDMWFRGMMDLNCCYNDVYAAAAAAAAINLT